MIAGRASDKLPRLELFTSRQLPEGAVLPGLTSPNVVDSAALRSGISGALQAVSGGSKDVMVIIPDASIRTLLLDFDSLPTKPQEIEPVIRFRMKKSFPLMWIVRWFPMRLPVAMAMCAWLPLFPKKHH